MLQLDGNELGISAMPKVPPEALNFKTCFLFILVWLINGFFFFQGPIRALGLCLKTFRKVTKMASFSTLRILCSVILMKGTGYPSAVSYANFKPA